MSVLRFISKVTIGIVIFIGLPLLGWGITDMSGFLSNPARCMYVVFELISAVVITIVLPNAGSNRGAGIESKTVRRQHISLLPLQLVPLAIVILGPWSDQRNIAVIAGSEVVRYTGLVLLVWGFVLMHWAEAALENLFSIEVTIQQSHRLITSGPFRLLRHPRYLGIILLTTGIALIFRSWLAILLVITLLPVLIVRIHDEDALMHAQFGDEWRHWAEHTWRLIPFIY